jgi:hypothetical protein
VAHQFQSSELDIVTQISQGKNFIETVSAVILNSCDWLIKVANDYQKAMAVTMFISCVNALNRLD